MRSVPSPATTTEEIPPFQQAWIRAGRRIYTVPLDNRPPVLISSIPATHDECPRCERTKLIKYFEDEAGHRRRLCNTCQTASGDQRLARFGVTDEEVQDMLKEQDWKCEICGGSVREMKNQHVDHDHRTRRVRGILCLNCNVGLGHFQDNPRFLAEAVAYLEKYSDPANQRGLPFSEKPRVPRTRRSSEEVAKERRERPDRRLKSFRDSVTQMRQQAVLNGPNVQDVTNDIVLEIVKPEQLTQNQSSAA